MDIIFNKANIPGINTKIKNLIPDNEAFLFHQSLPEYSPTYLYNLKGLASNLGVREIWVKDESHRLGLNSFKVLGASFAIHKILEKDFSIQTFCTATDGNHGKAVAWSAKIFNRKAVIFIPGNTVPARIDSIRMEGADVIIVDGNYDEAVRQAKKVSKINKWTLVQDSSWEGYEEIPDLIVSGYMTIFKELEGILNKDIASEVDFIFLQAGVGSFPVSAVLHYHCRYGANASFWEKNTPKFICVEPEKADCLFQSAKHGELTTTSASLDSIMAGLNCGTPSKTAWEILKLGVNALMTIPDEYAEKAVRKFYYPSGEDPKIISGESGAAGLGGLLALISEERFNSARKKLGLCKDSRILLINTEGETDPVNSQKIISR